MTMNRGVRYMDAPGLIEEFEKIVLLFVYFLKKHLTNPNLRIIL